MTKNTLLILRLQALMQLDRYKSLSEYAYGHEELKMIISKNIEEWETAIKEIDAELGRQYEQKIS